LPPLFDAKCCINGRNFRRLEVALNDAAEEIVIGPAKAPDFTRGNAGERWRESNKL